jgi:hypothetical protein
MIWVEILSRHHRDVAHRQRCDSEDITIGRGYDNDVVVDDPFVSPRHLRIRRDEAGRLVAEDLGSANGLFTERGRKRQAAIVLHGDQPVRIGHTLLRVRERAHAVAAERVAPRSAHTWPITIGLVLILASLESTFAWLRDIGEPTPVAYVKWLMPLALALVIWPTLWSILSRIFSGQARYERNLLITVLGIMAYSLINELVMFLGFALSWRLPGTYEYVVVWLLVAVACFFHLRAMGPARSWLKAGVVGTIAAVAIAVQTVTLGDGNPLFDRQATARPLLPPSFRLTTLHPPDRFLTDIDKLRERLDKDRRKDPGAGDAIRAAEDDDDE